MNRELLGNISFYSLILLLQLFIFNQINIFGFINPFVYITILILYRTSYDKTFLIILGFFIGLIIDLSMHTYGCHIFASISICYFRNKIEKYSFGVNSNLPLAMLKGTSLINRVTFFYSLIFVHLLIYYTLIFFNFNMIGTIIYYTLINSIITFIIVWVISKLISNK